LISKDIIDAFSDLAKDRGIDRTNLGTIIEDLFYNLIHKRYGEERDNFSVIVNMEKGEIEIYQEKEVVDEVIDAVSEIDIKEAKKVEPDLELGDPYIEIINPEDFGRRLINTGKQFLAQSIRNIEKQAIFDEYEEKLGTIVSGYVNQIQRDNVFITCESAELVLPKSEQIQNDRYRRGESVRGVVKSVEITSKGPEIVMSRSSNDFLERLFEMEVPEVFDGIITIKKVVRNPGERAKVCVESYDDRIDPVGACVGMKGSRIHGIVRELRNENIDVVNFTENIQLLITRALSPAKITSVNIDDENGRAKVIMDADQVSLAIGKGGQNIKLASRLLDLEIDVFRELDGLQEEDVDLEEFSDEIEGWIIDELKRIGLDTAKAVLNIEKDDLLKRSDLEEETVDNIRATLKKEFE
jgi:N utilization substance protein A